MRNEGLTLLMETASFWMGRATEINGRLEIHDVIGPDEYTEHVNNNAYTNYLAGTTWPARVSLWRNLGVKMRVLRRMPVSSGAPVAARGRRRGCDPAG